MGLRNNRHGAVALSLLPDKLVTNPARRVRDGEPGREEFAEDMRDDRDVRTDDKKWGWRRHVDRSSGTSELSSICGMVDPVFDPFNAIILM